MKKCSTLFYHFDNLNQEQNLLIESDDFFDDPFGDYEEVKNTLDQLEYQVDQDVLGKVFEFAKNYEK